jgi:hypothetical protein
VVGAGQDLADGRGPVPARKQLGEEAIGATSERRYDRPSMPATPVRFNVAAHAAGARRLVAAACCALLLGACDGGEEAASRAISVSAGDGASERPTAAPLGTAAPRGPAKLPELPHVELVVRSGAFAGGRLELVVALENRGARRTPALPLTGNQLRLEAPDGTLDAPLEVSSALDPLTTYLGLAAGSRNEGTVVFILPGTRGTHRLRLEGFEPIALDLAALPRTKGPGGGATAAAATAATSALEASARLSAVLAEQAAALSANDTERYLATWTPEQRRGGAELSAQLRASGVGPLALELLEVTAGERPDRRTAAVRLTYWLDELPRDNPFVHLLVYRFVAEGSGWLVERVEPPPGERLPFWAVPGMTRYASAHFVFFAPQELYRYLPAVTGEAEAAYARLAMLGLPLAERYAGHLLPRSDVAALAKAPVIGAALARYTLERGAIEVHDMALYLSAELYDDRSGRLYRPEARGETVQHELVHLALMPRTRPTTPVWLVEGAAVYFSGGLSRAAPRRLARRERGGPTLAALSGSETLASHGNAGEHYEYSGLAVAAIVERHGMAGFSKLYQGFTLLPPDRAMRARLERPSLGRGVVALFSAQQHQRDQADEVTRAALGVGLVELDAQVKEWIRREARLAPR